MQNQKIPIPNQPQLFLCEKCKVYFFSVSRMTKPTHYKCIGHNTRLVTNQEIDEINKSNNIHIPYNRMFEE